MIAFIVGIIVALVAALLGLNATWAWVLIILGLVVGLVNIGDDEVNGYLMAALVFIVSAGTLNSLEFIQAAANGMLSNFLQAVVLFVAPGAAITALRALYEVAKSK